MTLYKHILLPYDGSESATNALDEACRWLRESPETSVSVISVVPLSSGTYMFNDGISQPGSGYLSAEQIKDLQDDVANRNMTRLSADIESRFSEVRDRVSCEIVFGATVPDAIVDYAQDKGCDMVMMGSRGLGAIRGMLGSVSYAVLRKAPVPVFIIR